MSYLKSYRKLLITSINISQEKGHVKMPVENAKVIMNGIENDIHADDWNRQVSLLTRSSIERYEKKLGKAITPGSFGENIVIEGLEFGDVHLLDRIKCGEVIFEVTKTGIENHDEQCPFCEKENDCLMVNEGIFTRVVSPGVIEKGASAFHQPKLFRFHVITVSDRVSRGEYEDRSGMRILKNINHHFRRRNYHFTINQTIVPDDPRQLTSVLENSIKQNVDVIITTGGTGIGPRDITPDVAKSMLDREIPGIMDNIRIKLANKHPRAILSRNFAGIMDKSIIYLLPGSFSIVDDYMKELLVTMEDTMFMFHGLDIHQ